MSSALDQVILGNRLPDLFDAMQRALPATRDEGDAALSALWDAVKGQGRAECAVVAALQSAADPSPSREAIEQSLAAIPSGKLLHFERNGLSPDAIREAITKHSQRLVLWAGLFAPAESRTTDEAAKASARAVEPAPADALPVVLAPPEPQALSVAVVAPAKPKRKTSRSRAASAATESKKAADE